MTKFIIALLAMNPERTNKLYINCLNFHLLQPEPFMLSIGIGDEVGQFTQILHSKR